MAGKAAGAVSLVLAFWGTAWAVSPEPTGIVPDVRGLTLPRARVKILEAGFYVNSQGTDQRDTSIIRGQLPDAGDEVVKGQAIYVYTVAAPRPLKQPMKISSIEPKSEIVQVQAPNSEKPSPKPAVVPNPPAAPPTIQDHADVPLILPALPHGTYILVIPESGEATVSPAQSVKLIGPGPPGPPVPSNLTDRGKAMKAAADKATADPKRGETAQGLAKVYTTVAEAATPATKPADLANAVATGTSLIVSRQGQSPVAVAAWKEATELRRAHFDKAQEEGKGIEEYAAILKEDAAGLQASALKTAPSPEFWKWLIETILPIILKLLGL